METRISETPFSDLQIDALSELANIGSGSAATALSQMLGRSVDLSVPTVLALPLSDAVNALGNPEDVLTTVVLPVGALQGMVLMLFGPDSTEKLCKLLGAEPGSEFGDSALCEVGNILGSSYLGALSAMTGLEIEPQPPQLVRDMIAAIISTALAATSADSNIALMIESDLTVEGESCSFSFMAVPTAAGVEKLLGRLGL